jgi:putative DNA modification/repair radical SAM protein
VNTCDKLAVLSDAAKYDASCSSSGSKRQNTSGTGNAAPGGICHTWTEDGRCVSLLKILMTNVCAYDCAYCVNRRSNDVPRAVFSPEEIANLTMEFYRRNYIEGLFLSSGVLGSPDETMERIARTLTLLRGLHGFNGYIHAKAIPGSSPELIERVGLLADRISVNIELPSERSLNALAPQKSRDSILRPMEYIGGRITENTTERRLAVRAQDAPRFAPAGQSTQLIVGASPESDLTILRLSEGLYRRFHLRRVYYSAFVPVSDNPLLPALPRPPLLREHRLYQADWLLRYYGFTARELLDESTPDFDEQLDPKTTWALRNMHAFPVDVNTAPYETLLRIPGIGVRSAKRILSARSCRSLTPENLIRLGIVFSRARHFITCSGRFCGEPGLTGTYLRNRLLSGSRKRAQVCQLEFDMA